MSSRLSRAAGVSAIFTLFGFCLYFGFGVLVTVAQGKDAVHFALEAVLGSVICWVALTAILEPIMGAFDEINKPRQRDENSATGSPGAGEDKAGPSQE